MIGSRAWFALMRRNLIYRKRHWFSTIFELICPFCFVWILVAIKNASNIDDRVINPEIPAYLPADYTALIPFTYTDYLTAFQAERVCTTKRDPDFDISGIPDKGYNWQVPFIRCDSRKCQYLGQDAQPFCEYSIIAVTGASKEDKGGRERAAQFKEWMYTKWPLLRQQRTGNRTTGVPFDFDFVQLWNNPYSMDKYVKRPDYGTAGVPKLAMGIVFDGNSTNRYKYSLRQNSTNFNTPEQTKTRRPVATSTPPTDQLFNNFARTDLETCTRDRNEAKLGKFQDSCTGLYLYNGVIATQRLVGDFILDQTGAADAGYFVADAGVQFVQFPQKAFYASGFFASVENTAPLLIALGMLYPVAAMISYIVREKELRQKELMKMMSVMENDIGWAWFVTFAVFHLVSASCASVVAAVLYEHSSLLLLWIFWALTFLALVVFSMTLSTLSSKSARAVLIGLLVFFSGVLLTLVVNYRTGDPTIIGLISLHPVAAFAYGIKILGHLEDLDLGLVSQTLDYSDSRSGLSMLDIMRYLGIDVLLWSFLSWYLNRVIAPDYGQALPFWFPLDPTYWCRGMRQEVECSVASESTQNDANAVIPMEPVGDSLKCQAEQGKSIEIRNLRKDYGEKIAVDGLSLSMYSGQITALLGHNGAGKTTTINMLTGALAPTSGYATVAGKDIRTEISAIRQDIGICLQHDCLFLQLTVREHVQFFARIKGLYRKVSRVEAEKQVDQALIDVALSEKRHTLSKNLSGGMKRKLSVAIAFCGGSKVVLLDEPTSGQDPFSRRFTWNVIRHYKKDRIIILTTHFMDEADILGDRIAIMAEGRLRCVGSSLFLKKTYGVGYQLTIDKGPVGLRRAKADPRKNPEERETENHDSVSDVVDEHMSAAAQDRKLKRIVTGAVREANLLCEAGSELSYRLPLSAAPLFASMFAELDRQVEQKAISCYGVSITTLNEVFLLVTRGEAPAKKDLDSTRSLGSGSNTKVASLPNNTDNPDATLSDSDDNGEKSVSDDCGEDAATAGPLINSMQMVNLESEGLFTRHVVALLKKRGSYFRRDKKAWICTTIVPSLFVLVGFALFAFTAPDLNMSSLTLSLNDYNPGLQSNPITFNNPDNPFLCQPGICSHKVPYYTDELTNEEYVFCGYEAKLGVSEDGFEPTNETCTIAESANIMAGISSGYAVPDEAGVQNVTEGSMFLLGFSEAAVAAKYGAIWFSHFQDSIRSSGNGSLYNESVIAQCGYLSLLTNYNYSSNCARFGGVGYVVQYNHTALHAALLFETLANEALVRHATSNPDFVVETSIAPLPVTTVESNIGAGEDAFLVWFLVVISFPFIGGAFGSFVVKEKSSKAKHLQTVAGVEPTAYWISTFLWDTINYQIPLWATIALMFIFDVEILTTSYRNVFSGIATILFLFGPALAGFTYCVSFAFTSASMCNVFVIVSGFLIGMGGPLTCFILVLLARDPSNPNPSLENVANILIWVLRCTPAFCLGKGLFYAINIDFFLIVAGDESLSAWTEPILLYEVYFLLGQCVVFLLLAIQLDKWSTNPRAMSIWRKALACITFQWLLKAKEIDAISTLPDDDDVVAEQRLVLSGKSKGDLIVIKKLTKVYDDGKVAVDNLSLGIAPGECFGLLGINGAGKTTTMGLLTAEFPPTSGDAILGGYSVTHEPQKIRRQIGYCPQFDALFKCLTGREHLHLYGAVKGIPKVLLADAAVKKLREVGLSETDWDRMSSEYSGGMKRRLSLACATIGQPKLIFLDECSTGVDPLSRREIWQLVSDMVAGHGLAQKDKPIVILTTHSMDECEALCPRIGIMANGKLRCLGSAQHLKSKFGQGYQVELNVNIVERGDEDYSEIIVRLNDFKARSNFAEAECLNLEQCIAALKVLTGDDSLSEMICAENGAGYSVWKDAASPIGVSLDDLSSFAAGELRILKLEKFVSDTFPTYVLRERQDTKARFEVNGEGLRISSIFESIEENKDDLLLADYGVSQTSLEQVFNMHAAEAERQKKGRIDRLT